MYKTIETKLEIQENGICVQTGVNTIAGFTVTLNTEREEVGCGYESVNDKYLINYEVDEDYPTEADCLFSFNNERSMRNALPYLRKMTDLSVQADARYWVSLESCDICHIKSKTRADQVYFVTTNYQAVETSFAITSGELRVMRDDEIVYQGCNYAKGWKEFSREVRLDKQAIVNDMIVTS